MLNITFEQVRAAKPERIYYSVNTVWWTHDPADLKKARLGAIPADLFGSPLLETTNVGQFLDRVAIEAQEAYGKHAMRNFMLAHAQNIGLAVENLDAGKVVTKFASFADWCETEFGDRGAANGAGGAHDALA